tara:strand:- start:141 stop:392 length:252 start_codon:yes stop_codon:yes gene_type:complete
MIPLSVPNFELNERQYVKYCLNSWWISSAGFSFKYGDDFSEIKSVINNLIPKKLRMMGENSYKVLANNFQSKKSYELIAKKLK